MNAFLLGAIVTMCLIIAGLLLRSWWTLRDRLLLLFSCAFAIEGINRGLLALQPTPNEADPVFYLIRLLSYVIILVAILDKNLPRNREP